MSGKYYFRVKLAAGLFFILVTMMSADFEQRGVQQMPPEATAEAIGSVEIDEAREVGVSELVAVPGFNRLVGVFDAGGKLTGFRREPILMPRQPIKPPIEVFSSDGLESSSVA